MALDGNAKLWNGWNDAQPGYLQHSAESFMDALVFAVSVKAIGRAPPQARKVLELAVALFGCWCLAKGEVTLGFCLKTYINQRWSALGVWIFQQQRQSIASQCGC
jgi:hypothetical protein